MTCQPPFALFILEEGIDSPYIDEVLTRAHEGDYAEKHNLWVATDSHSDIPTDSDNPGTVPPVRKSYESPWLGKSVEECAKWLQKAPEDVLVNKDYFAVLNEFSKEDDTVLVCRVKDDGEVWYFPQGTDTILMEMWTNNGLKFDEKAQNYQATCETEGKPDRSRAGPY